MPSVFIYIAAADMMMRRCLDISSGNCRLHGLDDAEVAWRSFKPLRPGPELEGIVAGWYDDCWFDREERRRVSCLLFGADHRWAIDDIS